MDYFCPRHFITLQALNSPFVSPENAKSIGFKDLFIALRVCSTPNWTEAVKYPPFRERLKYYLLEGLIDNQMKAYVNFGHYISESMSVPKVWMKENESNDKKPTNMPETLSLVTILMTKFGFSEHEAWNMPFSKAVWYATAYGVQEGGEMSIITTESEEKEGEELDKLNQFEEAIKKAVKASQERSSK